MDFPFRFRHVHIPLEDMPEFALQIRDHMLTAAMAAKIELTRNGPEDLGPQVVYVSADKPALAMIQPVVIGDDIEPPMLLDLTLQAARNEFGKPALVAFMAEAYMREFGPDEDLDPDYERGDFQRDPRAKECLNLIIVYRLPDGGVSNYDSMITFYYADGTVQFDEPRHLTDEGDPEQSAGLLLEVMKGHFAIENN